MTGRHWLVIALAMLVSFAAVAVDLPQSSKFDRRIQYVDYNAGDVVLVRALPGLGARIVFAPGEEILDIGSGFSQGWDFQPRRNTLYVKPKSVKVSDAVTMVPTAGKWDTNLMVTTTRRMYDLDLQLLPGGGNDGKPAMVQGVAYRIEFRYPEDDKAKALADASRQATQGKLDAKPPAMNWHYSMQVGKASDGIAPTMAYDDGRFTYLRFPNNRDFPAAFLVAADESESLVNSHIDPSSPDVLVVHRVSRQLVLRLGGAVVGIYNDRFDADGVPPLKGTTVPGVQRVIISEGATP